MRTDLLNFCCLILFETICPPPSTVKVYEFSMARLWADWLAQRELPLLANRVHRCGVANAAVRIGHRAGAKKVNRCGA